jgi:hypothetical protein
MMQVSSDQFYIWVTDRMWMHQRNRMCSLFPRLTEVFDNNAGDISEHVSHRCIKSNQNKRRKKAWFTPVEGIWYVFKSLLSAGFNKTGFFTLYRNPQMDSIMLSVISTRIHIIDHMVKYKRIIAAESKRFCTLSLKFPKGNVIFNADSLGRVGPSVSVFYTQHVSIRIYYSGDFFAIWKCIVQMRMIPKHLLDEYDRYFDKLNVII